MPNSEQGISTTAATRKATYQSVACPFCGLVCDDLVVTSDAGRLTVEQNGCDRARAGFERVVPETYPRVGGKTVSLDDAIAAAAALIAKSRLPLFGGLATDVEGMRAMMALADRAGGVVDHVLSPAQYRNTNVLQTKGWFMSTLTETRNRADLVIVVASDLAALHPRFFERIATPAETMFAAGSPKRTIVLLGCAVEASSHPRAGGCEVVDIPCPPAAVPAVLGYLRARLKSIDVAAPPPAGLVRETLDDLTRRAAAASYGVVVWAPQALTFDGGDLVVQAISDIVRDLNKTTRFAGLSLGGNDGAASAASVCSWQSGYPLRVSFASGAPDYDPYRYDLARMIAAGEGDVLIWTSTFGPDPVAPPATTLPAVVLATPGIALASAPAVFIPVATPGLDHSGRLVRCDNVVSLPLRQLRQVSLPRLTDVAARIAAAL